MEPEIEENAGPRSRPFGERFAWVPIPLLLTGIIAGRVAGLNTIYQHETLTLVLSAIFYTLVSLGTLVLIGRSFLASGRPGLLLLECGVLLWSLAGTVGDAVSHGDANTNVTIFNIAILLSGFCHLVGAILSLRPHKVFRETSLWLGAGCTIVIAALWLLVQATLAKWLPVFFIPGQGGTVVRYLVLLSASFMFSLSAALIFSSQGNKRTSFISWYVFALLLLAVGLFGVMIQLSLGCVVNWLSRSAQWLGGIYLFIASIVALRESEQPIFMPKKEGRTFGYRYGVAIALVLGSTALRVVFLPMMERRMSFVTFFPVVMLASLYGGLGSGLLATVLSGLAVSYFLIPSAGLFQFAYSSDWLALIIFLLSGWLIAWVSESRHKALTRAFAAESQALLAAEREAATAVILEKDERLRLLSNNLPESALYQYVHELDGSLRFTYISDGIKRLNGVSVEDVLQDPGALHQQIPKEYGPQLLQAEAKSKRELSDFDMELPMRRTDGELRWMQFHSRPRRLPDGRTMWDGVQVDITERKKAETELKKLKNLLSEGERIAHLGTFEYIADTQTTVWSEEEYLIYGLDPINPSPDYEVMLANHIHPGDSALLHQAFTSAMQNLSVYELEHRIIRPDGTVRWVYDRAKPYLDQNGKLVRYLGVTLDITERKKAQDQIVREKELQQLLLDHFPGVVVLLRRPTREVVVSNQAAREVGAVCGAKCFETWGQSQTPCSWCLAPNLWESGEHQQVEIDGGEKVFEAHWVPVSDELYLHYSFDITERKRAQEQLQQKERMIQQSLSVSNSFTFDWDLATDQVIRSESFKKIFGDSGNETFTAPAKRYSELVHSEDRPRFEKLLNNLTPAVDTYTLEYRTVLSDGTVKTLEEIAQGVFDDRGKMIRLFGVATDITERKRAEEKLRQAEERSRLLVEHAPTMIYEIDFHKHTLKSVNDVMCRSLGYSREELLAMNPLDLLDDASKAVYHDRVKRILAGQDVPPEVEYKSKTKDGRDFFGALTMTFTYQDEKLQGAIVVAHDITERKQAEEKLQKEEAKSKLLAEITGRLLVSSNPREIVEELCRKVMAYLDCQAFFNFLVDETANRLHLNAYGGIPDEEARKIEWLDYGVAVCGCVAQAKARIIAEDIFKKKDIRTDLVKTYGIQAYCCHPLMVQERLIGTLSFGTKNRTHFKEEEVEMMRTVADQVAIAMERIRLLDETRRSHEELELRVRERTAELSETVNRLEKANQELEEFASIASHDLQEPLRKIQTFGDMAKKRCLPLADKLGRDYLDRVLQSAGRMRQLLQELLALSRVTRQKQPFKKIELTKILRDAADVFEVVLKETGGHITIENLPTINADESQMIQLFQNLIGNALKFRDDRIPQILVSGRVIDQRLCEIVVKDNGIGFDPQFAEFIFKPFERLHTRSAYEGTGMGLAICRKIVERHGGTIRAESEPGKGSTFIIRLPFKHTGTD